MPSRTKALRHIRLHEWLMASEAWRSLDCVARCLYIEVARRYRGDGTNNGSIPLSVREAAKLLHIGRNTANVAFHNLMDRGFLREGKRSGFNVKNRVSTEWVLTEFADDRRPGLMPTKDFMRWTSTKESTVPPQGHDGKSTVPSQAATVPSGDQGRSPDGTVLQEGNENGAGAGL